MTEQALQGAIAEFKSLLEPSHAWKVVPQSDLSTLSQKPQPSNTANSSNKSGIGQMSDVTVHKKSIKGGPDAVRATADLTVSDQVDIRDFKAVIQNPEVRVTCRFNASSRKTCGG